MSDGNFNTALLPHTPYTSGLTTGRMQMRSRAMVALKQILDKHCPMLTDAEREQIEGEFRQAIR